MRSPCESTWLTRDTCVRCEQALVQVFQHFDIDGDESLDMQEFLDLLKHTPLKIRQHDAMSMFNEVCFRVFFLSWARSPILQLDQVFVLHRHSGPQPGFTSPSPPPPVHVHLTDKLLLPARRPRRNDGR